MVTSAFVMLSPSAPEKTIAPKEDNQAKSEYNGAAVTKTYEISRIGYSYLKPTNYAMHGISDHTQVGVNEWYGPRNINYNDTVIHNSYPYCISYGPYSDNLANQASTGYIKAYWTTHTFYQLKEDAENLSAAATGPNKDPIIVPILLSGGLAQNGGWVNMSLYQTYLQSNEYWDIRNGTHYANTYYTVDPTNFTNTWKMSAYPNDGWLCEIHGWWEFNTAAAHKFLGLPGVGDLRAEYLALSNASRTKNGQNVAWAWMLHWIADGDTYKPYDIYAAYDWDLYTGNAPVYIWLNPDTTRSTSSKLVLNMWSLTWGAEYLFQRYFQALGMTKDWEPSGENQWINGTFTPTNGDLHRVMQATYHITAWKDTEAYNNPTWMMEPVHIDYTAERPKDVYFSEFDPYYQTYYDGPGFDWRPTRLCYSPGIDQYGKEVHYWITPMNWNLSSDEGLTIHMPATELGWGLVPYWANTYTVPGLAVAQMQGNASTGEWVLGHGYPTGLYSLTYYNPANKTITIPGGTSFAPNMNPHAGYTTIYETGSPLFYFDLSPVSHYALSIVESPPYYAQQPYTLRVTPLDLSSNPTHCNQTVDLPAIADVTYGSSSHTFQWNDTNWNTTVTFSVAGAYTLQSQDHYFYLDISDTAGFTVGAAIPEFPTLLIPVIGAIALFVVFGKRKSKK